MERIVKFQIPSRLVPVSQTSPGANEINDGGMTATVPTIALPHEQEWVHGAKREKQRRRIGP
jgi:hypothetical protein